MKLSCEISRTDSLSIPTISATAQIVNQQSLQSTSSTCLIFSCIVGCCPEHRSFYTSPQPSLNRLCQSKTWVGKGIHPRTPVLAKNELLLKIYWVLQETSHSTQFFKKVIHFNEEAHRDSNARLEAEGLLSFRLLNRRIYWRWGMSWEKLTNRLWQS